MSVEQTHLPIVLAGERIGDAVRLGENLLFFTTHPQLLDLDGKRFASAIRIKEEATRRMRGGFRAKPAAIINAPAHGASPAKPVAAAR